MASGNGLPARVHYENAHIVSAHSDFSRAVMQSMQFRWRVQKNELHPSRPEGLISKTRFLSSKPLTFPSLYKWFGFALVRNKMPWEGHHVHSPA